MVRRYRAAGAIDETGLPPALFPKDCPFTVEGILTDAGMGEADDLDDPVTRRGGRMVVAVRGCKETENGKW